MENKIRRELFKSIKMLEEYLLDHNFSKQAKYIDVLQTRIIQDQEYGTSKEKHRRDLSAIFLSDRCIEAMDFSSTLIANKMITLWDSVTTFAFLLLEFLDHYSLNKKKLLNILLSSIIARARKRSSFDISGQIYKALSRIEELPMTAESVGAIRDILDGINLGGIIFGEEGELIRFTWDLIHDLLNEVEAS
jgi:hypothetical protein